MSSARKKAAIRKAENEADHLRQRLILAEHHAAVMQGFAEAVARRSDVMRASLERIASRTQSTNLLWWQIEAREALAKDGTDSTAAMGSNVKVRGCALLRSPA